MNHGCPVWAIRHLDRVDQAQGLFYKGLFCLPPNTPNYAIRTEFNRFPLSCKVFKYTLNWLGKIMGIPHSRYPRALLDVAIQLYNNNNSLSKYNWLRSLQDVFFVPIGEQDVLKNLDTLLNIEKRSELVEKYILYRTKLDVEKCLQSSSLIIFPDIFSKSGYLNLKSFPDCKRFIAQLRLLNRYNQRIIYRGKIYVLNNDLTCQFCNFSQLDIFHFIFDCPVMDNLRTSFYLANLNVNTPVKAPLLFDSLDESTAVHFTKFILSLLNNYLSDSIRIIE